MWDYCVSHSPLLSWILPLWKISGYNVDGDVTGEFWILGVAQSCGYYPWIAPIWKYLPKMD